MFQRKLAKCTLISQRKQSTDPNFGNGKRYVVKLLIPLFVQNDPDSLPANRFFRFPESGSFAEGVWPQPFKYRTNRANSFQGRMPLPKITGLGSRKGRQDKDGNQKRYDGKESFFHNGNTHALEKQVLRYFKLYR